MLAFLSYQTTDKLFAGKVQQILKGFGVKSFLAHEDIEVSKSWQDEILHNLAAADIFVAILSQHYLASAYCMQESGIAAHRRSDIFILPVSLDGAVSPGFLNPIQSKRVDERTFKGTFFEGLIHYNSVMAINLMIQDLAAASSFRDAEFRFARLHPHLGHATDTQKFNILKLALINSQILHASECAQVYLPPLMRTHGHMLDSDERDEIERVIDRYQR